MKDFRDMTDEELSQEHDRISREHRELFGEQPRANDDDGDESGFLTSKDSLAEWLAAVPQLREALEGFDLGDDEDDDSEDEDEDEDGEDQDQDEGQPLPSPSSSKNQPRIVEDPLDMLRTLELASKGGPGRATYHGR
jgi:hypothetical protein